MAQPQQQQASTAILTVPNVLTFIRFGLTPVFLYLALGPDNIGAAFAVASAALATDLIDGPIARKYGQVSKLGIVLDPLADRIAIVAAGVVLLVHDLAPWWAVVAVMARDVLLVAIGAPLLKARGAPIPPVSRVGKLGSFAISVAFGLLVAAAIPGIDDPAEPVRWAGWITLGIGLPLYWAAGAGYIRAGLATLKRGEPPRG